MTAHKIDKARAQMILRHPFFASLMLRRTMVEDPAIPTACVNATGHIRYNPEWVESLTVEQVVFVLAHEVSHYMFHHPGTVGSRDHLLDNIAADVVINGILLEAGVGQFIPDAVHMPEYKGLGREEVYRKLLQDAKQITLSGTGSDLDHTDGKGQQFSESASREIQARIKEEIAGAAAVARTRGPLPGGLEDLIERTLYRPSPWWEQLARFMTERTRDDMTWQRPNRRYEGLYLPSLESANRMGTVVVGVDTSGSVGAAELSEVQHRLNDILACCRPRETIVVYADAKVQGVDRFEDGQIDVQMRAPGRGGTDMRVINKWIGENVASELSVYILFTDGETPWPDMVALGYPMVTVCSTKAEVPGEVVRWSQL